MIAETFSQLVTDPAHWMFEATTDVVLGFIFGTVVWPRIRSHIHRDIRWHKKEEHVKDDRKERAWVETVKTLDTMEGSHTTLVELADTWSDAMGPPWVEEAIASAFVIERLGLRTNIIDDDPISWARVLKSI